MTTSRAKTDEHTRRWLVWCDDDGESSAVALWSSANWPSHYVAEEFAEEREHLCFDFPVASGGSMFVHVKDDDGTVERFIVTGEFLPQYYAKTAKDGAL